MKIFEIGTGYTSIPARVPAATESVVEELTKALSLLEQDVEIIDVSDRNRAENSLPISEVKVPSCFTKNDVSLGIIHKIKRVVYSVILSFKLKKILKVSKEKVILHFHNQYNLFFFLKLVPDKLQKKALIAYTNHNGLWSLPWDSVKDTIKSRYFQELFSMKKADLIFVLNNATRDTVIKELAISKDKVFLIQNGVNTDVYSPLDEPCKNELKARYGLQNKKIILQVGSVYENKGQHRTIEALVPYLRIYKNLVFAYIGEIVSQEYYEKVIKTAAELDVVEQVHYLKTAQPGKGMNDIYNIADATIFSSLYEGFPLVCIESLSAGVPVILNLVICDDFGRGCIRIEENGVIESIVNDTEEYKALCNGARENALENYSWFKIAKDYLSIFKKITG